MSTPAWKGTLRFGAHAVPIKIFTGAREQSVSFNQVHAACGSGVKQSLRCLAEDAPVEPAALAKGVLSKDKRSSVIFTQAEIDAVSPTASDTLDLTKFVPGESIDPLLFAASYFIHPATAADEPLYAQLESTLATLGWLGLGRLLIYSRERYLAVRATHPGAGIVAHALFYREEARQIDRFRTDVSLVSDPPRLKLPRGTFQLDDLVDRQTEALRKLIASKTVPPSPAAAAPKPAGKPSAAANGTKLRKHPSAKAA